MIRVQNNLDSLLRAAQEEDEEHWKIACDEYIESASIFMDLRNKVQTNTNWNEQDKQDIIFHINQLLSFAIERAEHLKKKLKNNFGNNNIYSPTSIPNPNCNNNNNTLAKPIVLHYLFHFCDRFAESKRNLQLKQEAIDYYTKAAELGLVLIEKYKVPFQSEVNTVLKKAEQLKRNSDTSSSSNNVINNNDNYNFNNRTSPTRLSPTAFQVLNNNNRNGFSPSPNSSPSTSPSSLFPTFSNNVNNNSKQNSLTSYSSSTVERTIIQTTINGSIPLNKNINNTNINNNNKQIVVTNSKPLTDEEIEVLKYTSIMKSGLLLYPWSDRLDTNDENLFNSAYSDNPSIPLSKEQSLKLFAWKRPHEILQLRFQLNQNQKAEMSGNEGNIPPLQMIHNDQVDELRIVQSHVVTDCSFVASLCVAALYEKKYNTKLITNSIFPQDPKTGKPIYNPYGKYSVRLYFNGVARKVVVDDLLPIDAEGNLLCSYSTCESELWVSIMEKAYMKLNGGYLFPGSNSGIDLHALTGWIPEEVKITRNTSSSSSSPLPVTGSSNNSNFDKELLWRRMYDGFQLGKCLITISTGKLDKSIEEQLGLYGNHAYAILDVREVKVTNNNNTTNNNNGSTSPMTMQMMMGNTSTTTIKRLLKVKNPWTKKRWKGPYSPNDQVSWTPQLKKELNYDTLYTGDYDNGVFWMNYESLLKYFQTVHMSWNPDLFPHTEVIHACWDHRLPHTPLDGTDHFTMSGNPQYRLKLSGKGSVWIMLTKHVTSLEERDMEFVTFHVYKGSNSASENASCKQGTDRVFYNSNALIHQGRYSNDPHYRICLNTDDNELKSPLSANSAQQQGNNIFSKKRSNSISGGLDNSSSNSGGGNSGEETTTFKIVLSQHDAIRTIRYSLHCYSTVPCTLELIPYYYKYMKSVRDQWTSTTCGGSCNQISTYRLNPQYLVYCNVNLFSEKTNLRFSCSTKQPLDVNIMVFCNQGQPIHLPTKELMITTSGNYRRSFCVCKLTSQELSIQKGVTNQYLVNKQQVNNQSSLLALTVVISNFTGSLGDFDFRVESTHIPFELKKIV
ncbi:hypothetical protein ABK040_007539 [Willaertia magna]